MEEHHVSDIFLAIIIRPQLSLASSSLTVKVFLDEHFAKIIGITVVGPITSWPCRTPVPQLHL